MTIVYFFTYDYIFIIIFLSDKWTSNQSDIFIEFINEFKISWNSTK